MSEYDPLEEFDGWDDAETLTLEPVSELETSGESWTWYPVWELQNHFGADRERWGIECPPLTTSLRAKLHPIEVAYYEGRRDVWIKMIAHAARKMDWSDKYGWTAEDVASDAMAAMLPLGFEVGGSSWVKMSRRVMNNRISKLLASQTAREDNVVPDYPHEDSETPEFVSQVFSDQLRDVIESTCTVEEFVCLTLTYEQDMSGETVARLSGFTYDNVRKLLERGRIKLQTVLSQNGGSNVQTV